MTATVASIMRPFILFMVLAPAAMASCKCGTTCAVDCHKAPDFIDCMDLCVGTSCVCAITCTVDCKSDLDCLDICFNL
ncbi:hypothetical protein Cob_v013139 [Colletotrichum orbiculare MAFF 240422]|uniref:Uncharacterized protein n=1 Tax=Colletotrichum orbiculare (strain 104-T / ATCC 96160 / CBS 514.97 / LARS 414 / MAFF 240422) TaxID=1213857 RepID=A0A484F8R2_COLOR|nr:hypothetical protein Cob_v013139 [Colletotrichum orbiculare MAFF 240422]